MATSQEESASHREIEALRREVERLRSVGSHEHGLLQAVLRHSPHGIIVCNAAGQLILQNQASERIWAGSASASSVREWKEYRAFHPDGRPYVPEDWGMARCLCSGVPVDAEEVDILRFDGTRGTLLGSCAPIFGEDRKLTGAVSVFADITRFKELERATIAQRKRDEFLVQASTILLSASLSLEATLGRLAAHIVPAAADWCVIDIVDHEPRATFLHRDPSKMAALSELRRRFPGSADMDRTGVPEVLRTGEPLVLESASRAANEKRFDPELLALIDDLGWFSSMTLPMRARGRMVGAITFVSASDARRYDAGDVAMAESLAIKSALAIDNARLFQSEQRMRSETQTLYSLLDAISRAGSLDEVCDAALTSVERGVGIRRSAILLYDGAGVMRFRAWRGISEAYRVAVEGRSPWPRDAADPAPILVSDVTASPKTAEILPLLRAENLGALAFIPLLHQRELLGKFMLYSDVPRAFAAEDVRLVQGIAAQVAHAVAKKRSEAEALDARRSAEEANRMKDEFLAVVSHELRTPLSVIAGWTALLRAGNHPDAQAIDKGLAVIERNVHAQTKIIEDILDVSRIVTGKLVIEPVPVALSIVVQDTLDSVRAAAIAKHIDICFDGAEEPFTVVGDCDRLRQIVWNLLSNALKFTPEGGRVEVSVERGGGGVVLRVKDNGKGIAPEFLPHVFERFRQADSSTTRRHTGLGLGLAIVRHLVELHGGRVRAASEGLGKGATFEVTLPVPVCFRRADSMPVPTFAPACTPRQERATRLDGIRVLAVDDDPDARELLTQTLRGFGADVHTADSARAALRDVSTFDPAVLIADVGMPEEDGYSLMRKLRAAQERSRRVPAIALTAFARPEEARRAFDAGFDRHLAKPADPNELVEAIRELVASPG